MGFTYLKFYTADWLEDTATLSLQGQGLWMRVICRLSKSQTPGEATYTQPVWSRLLGIPPVEFPSFVQELIDGGVGEVIENDDDTWTIRSNRMVKDWQEFDQVSEKRREAGRAGGKASAKARGKANGQSSAEANASDLLQQNANQNETDGQALPEARSQKPVRSNERTTDAALDAVIPTFEEVKEYADRIGATETTSKNFFDWYQGKNLWLNKHSRLIDWKYELQVWRDRDRQGIKTNGKCIGNSQTVDRNQGTANAGKANQYANLGRVVSNQSVR